MVKQFKVLLHTSSSHKLRISNELAGCFDTGEGEGAPEPTAIVVSPFGTVWPVKVGQDGDGAFLGRGWAEFLPVHGVGLGWFVVLWHEGGGTLTVKMFDTSLCIKEFIAPAAEAAKRLPARFVKGYITKEWQNSQTAIIVSPLGKCWQFEFKNDQSGIFFTGRWSQFLDFHGISKGEVLLLRYEGNMVSKFKAFGLNGCQKVFKNQNAEIKQNTEKQQETPSPIRKCNSSDEKSKNQNAGIHLSEK
ncbi:hypothetical protein SORBI_3009G093000 [Sorghum bicolor]|uniref:TF-B3 domain-containing protein n=1 Tax=Sorghum bicolor TaxID=4558 RepID=C5YVQ7_SORBI|nr:hypothetical protein SORBI_3009G093000 [Sorghum bicolor]